MKAAMVLSCRSRLGSRGAVLGAVGEMAFGCGAGTRHSRIWPTSTPPRIYASCSPQSRRGAVPGPRPGYCLVGTRAHALGVRAP